MHSYIRIAGRKSVHIMWALGIHFRWDLRPSLLSVMFDYCRGLIPAGELWWIPIRIFPCYVFLTHIQYIIPISLPLKNEQAFVVPSIGQPALTTSTTSLDASRLNAKQEKRKRNRENMRKFKKGGRKGTSRKKMMRKLQSSAQRQVSCLFANYIYIWYPFNSSSYLFTI